MKRLLLLLMTLTTLLQAHPLKLDSLDLPLVGKNDKKEKQDKQDKSVSLTLVATLDPPEIDGTKLQANTIYLDGNLAIVTYNLQGEECMGGFDILFVSNPQETRLLERVLYPTAKVNCATMFKDTLYLALGRQNEEGNQKPVIQSYSFKKNRLEKDSLKELELEGICVTSLEATRKTLFATVAAETGLVAIDADKLTLLSSIDLHDPRWVTLVDQDEAVVLQGTPGLVSKVALSDTPLTVTEAFDVGGLATPEAKSTIEIIKKCLFIASGSEGVVLMNLNTGNIAAQLPIDYLEDVDRDDQQATSVSADKNLIFAACGGSGVYLIQANKDFRSDDDDGEPVKIQLLGRLDLGRRACANHVVYRKNYLLVASGIEGVKVISVNQPKLIL